MLANIGMPKKSKKGKGKSNKITIIQVNLFPPTNRKYPRFDYEQMKKRVGIESDSEEDDEFRDPDADAIVKRLEQKYGTNTVGNKCSKRRKAVRFEAEDIMDKGMGYDLTDNFIDDSQAYDEWVPSSMDTLKGGHYVNKGQLEFRQIDSDESSSGEDSHDDDDEEEEDEDDDDNISDDDMEEDLAGKAASSSSSNVVVAMAAPPQSISATSLTNSATKNMFTINELKSSGSTSVGKLDTKSSYSGVEDDSSDVELAETRQCQSGIRLSQAGVPPTRRLPTMKRFGSGHGQ